MFVSDADLSFMITAFHCFLEFPRKLPRAKPCSDPNRVREPGEVEFDIEVRTCPISNLLLFLVTETILVVILVGGGGDILRSQLLKYL